MRRGHAASLRCATSLGHPRRPQFAAAYHLTPSCASITPNCSSVMHYCGTVRHKCGSVMHYCGKRQALVRPGSRATAAAAATSGPSG